MSSGYRVTTDDLATQVEELSRAGEQADGLVASARQLAVRDCGGDPGVLDRLVSALPTLAGRGQLGATRRTGTGDRRQGGELSWLDGSRGRLRVSRTDAGWVSVNPLRPAVERAALADLVAIAREQR